VLAVHIPLFEEINDPFIHSHRSDGENQNELAALVAGHFDLHGNLVAHICAKLFQIFAGIGRKVLVPEGLAIGYGRGVVGNALHNPGNIPPLWQNLAEIRAFQGIEHVHNASLHISDVF
jgi:hypothetical protein